MPDGNDLADGVPLRGATLAIREMRPRDAPAFRTFVRDLSQRSRRGRFWSSFGELPPDLDAALTEPGEGRVALVAEVAEAGGFRIIAEARYVGDGERGVAEIAIVVADAWQRRGIARVLISLLRRAAIADGYDRLSCMIQADNDAMRALARSCGYEPVRAGEVGVDRFERRLLPVRSAARAA
jgi:acetyltransferase